jgi:hypothetical protein
LLASAQSTVSQDVRSWQSTTQGMPAGHRGFGPHGLDGVQTIVHVPSMHVPPVHADSHAALVSSMASTAGPTSAFVASWDDTSLVVASTMAASNPESEASEGCASPLAETLQPAATASSNDAVQHSQDAAKDTWIKRRMG